MSGRSGTERKLKAEAAAIGAERRGIDHLLGIAPEAKPAVYGQVFGAAEIADLNYWLELIISAAIATLGLVLNSAAVVIGAMLISPLMGPIIAAGLALAAADLYLGIKSVLNLAASIAVAVAFSSALVWMIPFHVPTSEILARTAPNLLDLGVAFFSGLAGSIIVCRGGGGGGVSALPGVAIAVALMPPLCTVGFGVGSGFQAPIMRGAGLLFVTNLAAIVTSAFLVFVAVRMNSADVRATIDDFIAARAPRDRLYRLLGRTGMARSMAHVGKLHFRILMPVTILALLFIPLRSALFKVRDEARARAAVLEAVRGLAPTGSVVSQEIDLSPDVIRVRLILTETVPRNVVEEAERQMERRTGKRADLTVRKVAGEEELASLRERLRTATPPPPPPSFESMHAEVLRRVEEPIRQVWPSNVAQLKEYQLAFSSQNLTLAARYEAEQPLDPAAEEVLLRVLRERLGIPQLVLKLEHIPPPPPEPSPAARKRGRAR